MNEEQLYVVGEKVTVQNIRCSEDGYLHGTVIDVIRTNIAYTGEPCYVYDYKVQLEDGRIGWIEWGSWLEELDDEEKEA